MDPSILVAIVSVATAFVTTLGGVLVAIITNRREAENAADDAMAMTLRERLVLRDEQIAGLEHKVRNRDAIIAQLRIDLATEQAKNKRTPEEGPDHAEP